MKINRKSQDASKMIGFFILINNNYFVARGFNFMEFGKFCESVPNIIRQLNH